MTRTNLIIICASEQKILRFERITFERTLLFEYFSGNLQDLYSNIRLNRPNAHRKTAVTAKTVASANRSVRICPRFSKFWWSWTGRVGPIFHISGPGPSWSGISKIFPVLVRSGTGYGPWILI